MDIYNSTIYRNVVSDIASQLTKKQGGILITGATGLIGSCMIDVLLAANRQFGCQYQVYALGRTRSKLQARFSYAEHDGALHLIAQDICDPLDLSAEIDYIVHAASNADPRSYALYPVETLLTNIDGTANICRFAQQQGNARILFTSTFEVYGQIGHDAGYREEEFGRIDFNQMRSCYPESKRCAEILLKCFQQEYGLNYSIARLGSIYGPTMDERDSKAHAQFIKNAYHHENIVLKSEGKPRRTYCCVFDAVRALFQILFDGVPGEAYNIAASQLTASIAEVARTLADISGQQVVFDLPDEVESRGFSTPQDSILDGEKIKALGWEANYSLKEGLALTLSVLRECGNK